jgi:hypothetical protein
MDEHMKQCLANIEKEIITIYQKMTGEISSDNKEFSPWILFGSAFLLVEHCTSYESQKNQFIHAYGYLDRAKQELYALGLKHEDFNALEHNINQAITSLTTAIRLDPEEEKSSFSP